LQSGEEFQLHVLDTQRPRPRSGLPPPTVLGKGSGKIRQVIRGET